MVPVDGFHARQRGRKGRERQRKHQVEVHASERVSSKRQLGNTLLLSLLSFDRRDIRLDGILTMSEYHTVPHLESFYSTDVSESYADESCWLSQLICGTASLLHDV